MSGDSGSSNCIGASPDEPMNNSSLISSSEAVSTVDRKKADCSDISLYYISENGTWYHANRSGETLSRAPNGSETVVGNTEIQFNKSQRPLYVWKLTYSEKLEGSSRSGAATYVVHAKSGELIERVRSP